MSHGWFGIDLDGTLAHYDEFEGADKIGAPILRTVFRVRYWLRKGRDVRIFTARVAGGEALSAVQARHAIDRFCTEQFGKPLPVTNEKDYGMVSLLDDRCEQVIPNTGKLVSNELVLAIRALRAIEVNPQNASAQASLALSKLDAWSLKLAHTN